MRGGSGDVPPMVTVPASASLNVSIPYIFSLSTKSLELISVSRDLRIWKDVNLEFLCLATLFHKKSIEVKKVLTAARNINFKLTRFSKQISCKFIKTIQFYAVPDVHTQKDKEIFTYSINSRNSWWILIIMGNRKDVARYTFNQNHYSCMANHIVTRITTAV